ncbi:hypothetical protein L6452_16628 [Arctium lappa]|uniref:Uncharacterized protein n=1 Tax=Arctium lappa TaxID=4217 RepID=A0ACB9C184_ARCLA|nr:hypothetical protein L6452_16628 [Arctium lappa]
MVVVQVVDGWHLVDLIYKMSFIFVISLLLVHIYLGGASMEIHQALSRSRCAHKKRTERGRMCLVLTSDLVHPICGVFADDLVASIYSGDLVVSIYSGDMWRPSSPAIWSLPTGGRWMSRRFGPSHRSTFGFKNVQPPRLKIPNTLNPEPQDFEPLNHKVLL